MKKGLIKAGLIGFLFLFLLGLITFSILSSAYSYSYEKTYYVGEGIHINLGEERAYVLRIISPEEEFVTKGSGESIYYLPKEPGIYKFYISYGGNLDKYTFHVIEKGKNQGNQNNITLNNSYSDNLFHAQTRERQLGRLNKEVIVYTENNLDQENVLADASVDEIIKIEEKDKIKLYWKEHKSYIDFEAEDKDEDGYIDKIQWIIPELNSEQTFEIILISKAEHLSSNKTFISDIYEQVQKLDNVWSETINSEEYVRATFEKNLTSSNDITIFPRIINGNPTVEVYEKDSNILIAEFENMIPNDYNKILLTNLQGSQNTFDLKVIGGSVEFDYIVDPSDYISCDEDHVFRSL